MCIFRHKMTTVLICRVPRRIVWLYKSNLSEWISDGILSDRLPLVVRSNPALIMPRQVFRHPEMYIGFAARLISAAVCYKHLIDDNDIPTETYGKVPLDMSQNMGLFGSCRIPARGKDVLHKLDPFNSPNHIVVAHNNHVTYSTCHIKTERPVQCQCLENNGRMLCQFFRVPVHNVYGEPLTPKQIECQLQKVVHESRDRGTAVGILTTDHRDKWSELYEELLKGLYEGARPTTILRLLVAKYISENAECLDDIKTALFMVCLDGRPPQTPPSDHTSNLQTMAAMKVLHGAGPYDSSGNRWFDKTLQFVVGCTGEIGLCLEQSSVDCQIVMNLLTYILDVM
ncbi:Carnitine O-acetyltransferase [Blattella germanica]|nr:Carnitine O-acetyltransferase [Blattella germanica]